MYAKAKDTSVLIRLPCNLAETVANKSLKITLTVADPLVKPLYGFMHQIDDYASEKLRQIESKYPAINTPTEEIMNTFNEKTESVRHVMNSVKDTTTSTIQHGTETVFHVATATKVFQYLNAGKTTELREHTYLTVSSLFNYVFQSVQSSSIWSRMLTLVDYPKFRALYPIPDIHLDSSPNSGVGSVSFS
ncbi:unnamed protein product [Rotaria sordida]|uniref:Uncharacterized protein n=2 Tax=Rotaria sordida TaxID=392033 RepID=A0A819K1B3_9BILA|nr:unnamed protein product [Rotaria sordida]